MALTETREPHPRPPRLDEIDGSRVKTRYDPLGDTLWLTLVGEARPVINVYAEHDDDLMYLVDPYTEEVIGLEIEHFLGRALQPSEGA